MNRMKHRAVPVALTILLFLPGIASGRGASEPQRLQAAFDFQTASGSFLTAVVSCGPAALPCASVMPWRPAALREASGSRAGPPASSPMPVVTDDDDTSRVLLGGIGLLLLGCVARLRETRRRPFRLLDPHAH